MPHWQHCCPLQQLAWQQHSCQLGVYQVPGRCLWLDWLRSWHLEQAQVQDCVQVCLCCTPCLAASALQLLLLLLVVAAWSFLPQGRRPQQQW